MFKLHGARIVATALPAILFGAACHFDLLGGPCMGPCPPPPPPPPPPPTRPVVASIQLMPLADTVEVARGRLLFAVLRDSAGHRIDDSVTWSSGSPGVATIALENGAVAVVTGRGSGVATITAMSQGKLGTAHISVLGQPADFASVGVGLAATCALTSRGAAYCWGKYFAPNPVIPLGDVYGNTFLPIRVTTTVVFSSLSTDGQTTCGITPNGGLYCWGYDNGGELGSGSSVAWAFTPLAVSSDLAFSQVTVTIGNACAVALGGAAYCWGDNRAGQLGNGSTVPSSIPVAVFGNLSFSSISVGRGTGTEHTCGVTVGGAAYCWGTNDLGELGDGSTTSSATPVAVAGGLAFQSISAGRFEEAVTCGVAVGGSAYCWGGGVGSSVLGLGGAPPGECRDSHGELVPCTTTPMPVSGGLAFSMVSVGAWHTCGVTTAGLAYCWGYNPDGELGIGSTDMDPHPAPVPVRGGLKWASIAAGTSHTCGVTTNGVTYCWGANISGELGDGVGFAYHPIPTRVFGQP